MAAAFGKAAFIEDEYRVKRLVHSLGGHQWRRRQGLANQRTQLIAAALLIPDSTGEQALHAVGPQLPGVFGDLPAIFPGNLTEDGTQIEQGVLAHFGAGKMKSQSLMQT